MTKTVKISSLLLGIVMLATQFATAQSWLELREQGANYYDIKAAFERQYRGKIKEMNRELRREVEKGHSDAKSEQAMEGMIQFMRWSSRVEPRIRESNGDLGAIGAGISRAIAAKARDISTRAGATWTLVGPKSTPSNGGNGRVNAVRAHPTTPTTLFACTPAGGLWKSTNSGTAWTPIADQIALLGATDVAFDPTNPNIMYLATGDGEAGDAYSTGIYKSTDGGTTWAATGLTFIAGQKKLFSKIIVNATTGAIVVGGSAGIYRSINGGTNWTQVSSLGVRDLEVKPTNPSILYAGGYGANIFLRSTDAGATWAATGTGLPTTGVQRVAVAVTALDTNYVYAFLSNNTDYGFKGLYLSTDGGTTFTSKSTTPNVLGWNAAGNDAGGQGWYDLSIAVDPSVKTTIYVGGVNVWKSTTSGATWACVAHWSGSGAPYIHADNHDFTFVGSTLYVGNDGGVFSSANGGSTWSDKSSNLANAQLYGMGQSTTNANLMLSGHQDNGTNLTTNATTWSQNLGGDGMLCFIDRTNDAQMFGSIYNGALYRSTNTGASFSSIKTVAGGGWVTPWLQDPVTASIIYAGGTNVEKSTNSGTSWATISAFSGIGTLVSLDVATTNAQCILAASATKLMKTINGGTAWTDITTGLPAGTSILNVRFDPTNALKIYVALASYTGNSAFCSTDGGTTWVNISSGLPLVPANCFVTQSNGDTYCGTDMGVYLRASGATTWTAFSAGMPGVPVNELRIFVPTGKLRAATYGRGIWESPLNSFNNAPTVSITSPTNSASFNIGSSITINATAADADGTITSVAFYNGATLLGTSTVAPYTYTWVNPATGSYALTAKATDNGGAVTTSAIVNVSVAIQLDAGISAITTPNGAVGTASAVPSVTLKNFGTTTLTATPISYKVDNNAFAVFNWTGSLAAGATAAVTLPSVTGYAAGAHTFTAQTGTVNGSADGNTANDALTANFTYTINTCTNDNETANNASTTAVVLTVNTAKNSQIGSNGDVDYYKFTTTATAPKVKITLSNLPADYDLDFYSATTAGAISTKIATGAASGTTAEVITYNTQTTAKTYYLRVYGYNGAFSTATCYNLLVQTSNVNFAKEGVLPTRNDKPTNDVVLLEQLSLFPNPATNEVNVQFVGTQSGDYNVSLFNATGKTILAQKVTFNEGNNNASFDVSTLPRGLYVVKVSNGAESFSQKVIIE
jgi:Bacterial Ig domain/Secretion system C-terminal sorting domain/Bacterial pre-peptidase C-terminal domain